MDLAFELMVLEELVFVGVITGLWANPPHVKVHLCHPTWLESIESVGDLGLGAVFLMTTLRA